jgi:hypothetical protein
LRRISDICTAEDIAVEVMRESLRDRRWKRRRSMLGVASRWGIVVIVVLGVPLPVGWQPLETLVSLL